jgi:hypothetical protein
MTAVAVCHTLRACSGTGSLHRYAHDMTTLGFVMLHTKTRPAMLVAVWSYLVRQSVSRGDVQEENIHDFPN